MLEMPTKMRILAHRTPLSQPFPDLVVSPPYYHKNSSINESIFEYEAIEVKSFYSREPMYIILLCLEKGRVFLTIDVALLD